MNLPREGSFPCNPFEQNKDKSDKSAITQPNDKVHNPRSACLSKRPSTLACLPTLIYDEVMPACQRPGADFNCLRIGKGVREKREEQRGRQRSVAKDTAESSRVESLSLTQPSIVSDLECQIIMEH